MVTEEQARRVHRWVNDIEPDIADIDDIDDIDDIEPDVGDIDDIDPVPVAPALQAKVIAAVLREIRAPSKSDPAGSAPVAPVIPIDRARRRGRRVFAQMLPLVAAAALVLALPWLSPSPGPLPRYQVSLHAGDGMMGAAPDPSVSTAISTSIPTPTSVTPLAPGARLDIDVRPAERVEGAAKLHAFLQRGAAVAPWAVRFEHLGGGRFRLAALADELPQLAPGTCDVVLVIARPHTPASDILTALRHGTPPPQGAQVYRRTITLQPRR